MLILDFVRENPSADNSFGEIYENTKVWWYTRQETQNTLQKLPTISYIKNFKPANILRKNAIIDCKYNSLEQLPTY